MIHYLNGDCTNCSELGRSKRKRGSATATKFSKKIKALDEKRKLQHRKIIAEQKALAKRAGLGLKRIAKIPKGLAFKKLLFALEKDVFGMATRLTAEFRKSPVETANFIKTLGDYNQLKNAINKGSKSGSLGAKPANYRCHDSQGHTYYSQTPCAEVHGDEESGGTTAAQYEEYTKQSVGLIQQIIAWFKKRKADKAADKAGVDAMADAVDADSDIEKVDENGRPLPDSEDAEAGSGEGTAGGGMEILKSPILWGGLAVGAYFLMKKN